MGVLVVVWLLVAAALASGKADRPRTPIAPRCTIHQLTAAKVSAGGAGGTFYTIIDLRNTSARSCTLRGFATLSFVGCRHDHWHPCSNTYPMRLSVDDWGRKGAHHRAVLLLPRGARAESRIGAGVGGYLRHDEITVLRIHLTATDAGLPVRIDSPSSGPPGRRDVIGVAPFRPATRAHS